MTNKKFIIIPLIILLIFSGCYYNTGRQIDYMEESEIEFDGYNFYADKINDGELIEYGVYYMQPEGTPTLIVNIGTDPGFNIINKRIYFTKDNSLQSVNLKGQDNKVMHIDSDLNYSFESINSYDDQWIYCEAQKWEIITDDPVAIDGPHRVDTVIAVNYDFTQWEEIPENESEE